MQLIDEIVSWSPVSEDESMAILLAYMAAGRQAWHWNSSWEPISDPQAVGMES